jgi:hypothetical protein
MNNRGQSVLFVLITMVGVGVVATAITMPPSRFDPLGSQTILGVIGALVTIFAATCAILAFSQVRQAEWVETATSLDNLNVGAIFVIIPALMSVLIVNRLISTDIVLAAIFILVGSLVIWVLPGLRFERKTIGSLIISAVVLTVGVTQLFQQVLGLPLP